MEIALFPQRSFGRALFERVPTSKGASTCRQSFEFGISAFLGEHVPNLVEVACNIRLQSPRPRACRDRGSRCWDRAVLRSVPDIIEQFVRARRLGLANISPVSLYERVILVEVARDNEFERVKQIREANWHLHSNAEAG
jgi:hypothetical protein